MLKQSEISTFQRLKIFCPDNKAFWSYCLFSALIYMEIQKQITSSICKSMPMSTLKQTISNVRKQF